MQNWGVDLDDPEAKWRACDQKRQGFVTFDEFCDWAIRQNFEQESQDSSDSGETKEM